MSALINNAHRPATGKVNALGNHQNFLAFNRHNERFFGNKCPLKSSKSSAKTPSSRTIVNAAAQIAHTAEDKWINTAINEASPKSIAPQLQSLQSSCLDALSTLRMPTTKNEEYRFTDITPIIKSTIQTPQTPSHDALSKIISDHPLSHDIAALLVIVDGTIDTTLSSIDTSSLPPSTYIGSIQNAPKDIVSFALGAQSRSRGGPFAILNGAFAQDAAVIHIPSGATITKPIHIVYISSGAQTNDYKSISAPRVLVVLEEGATAEIVEEFTSATSSSQSYLCTAVTEIELDDTACLKHSYVVLDDTQSTAHFKTTLVNQGKESEYSLTETRTGGSITRHDLDIDQLGDATKTFMQTFLLAGQDQTHDLHSKLRLNHPDGQAEQLHKCIAADPTARGVFDGNVKVNRLAQRTDAQQLSRNLLLSPRATVNVKPNLQIIADDVKCTHGCAVSDLEDEQLFYLRARGISEGVARQVLVYSFGKEVVQHLRDDKLIERVEEQVTGLLKNASFDAY